MTFSAAYTRWRSNRALKKIHAQVKAIGLLEPSLKSLSDDDLRSRFKALTQRPAEDRLIEGFAIVREASHRALGLRPFDVQLVGGLVLLQGKLAEMRTGEGKTLTIVAPAALRALDGKGVHVVTANSYLARRDAQTMRPLYEFLGLQVSFIDDGQPLADKQAAYQADVTYGVGHEFGFDYLRDNLVRDLSARVQRPLHAAIVDEIDSILIDEARTPMIISGSADDVTDSVRKVNTVVRSLKYGEDFEVNLKEQAASLTDAGYTKVERLVAEAGLVNKPRELYDAHHLWLVRRVHSAVKAYALYRKDRDYVVEHGEIVLVDAGTGRKMQGRRLEDGLHEALEAREGVAINLGTVVRAAVTYQNFFALYSHLAGLTGTAATEADEFNEIYGLETVVIPTNRPIQRRQLEDIVFLTKSGKFASVVNLVKERHQAGQPVLVGCATIRDAEVLSKMLQDAGLPHEMLTAKHLEREATVIAQAGRIGAITVATNMAGRGTDINLGGERPSREHFDSKEAYEAAIAEWKVENEKVIRAGGLFVLGTERSGIRRVDNQLAGRSGRQGDPGMVQFYLSLEDELLRVFGENKRLATVRRLIEAAGGAMGGNLIAKLVTTSQARYESQGFDSRRTLMKFDKTTADQRQAVYGLRTELLNHGVRGYALHCIQDALEGWLSMNVDMTLMPEQWDAAALKRGLQDTFGISAPVMGWIHKEELDADAFKARLIEHAQAQFEKNALEEARLHQIVFSSLDDQWTQHLTALGELKDNVSLKTHQSLNPVYQFHKEAFELFQGFQLSLASDIAAQILDAGARAEREAREAAAQAKREGDQKVVETLQERWITRNEACPCGSGKKFRLCHGVLAA